MTKPLEYRFIYSPSKKQMSFGSTRFKVTARAAQEILQRQRDFENPVSTSKNDAIEKLAAIRRILNKG